MGNTKLFCMGLILLAFMAAHLSGQSISARIVGNVKNEEGAFLAGVTVEATNVYNNSVVKTVTGEKDGAFRLLGLAPGMYQVSFDREGYQSYVAAGISLSVEQSVTLRIKLLRSKNPGEVVNVSPPEQPLPPAMPHSSGPWKKWQLELASCALRHAPADLNQFVPYDQMISESRAYYYHSLNFNEGNPFSPRGSRKGALMPLSGSREWAARLRYSLSRTLSLAIGIGYFDNLQDSTYSISYHLVNREPGFILFPMDVYVSNEYTSYALGMKGFSPSVGVQARLPLLRHLSFAGFVNTGLMFAECRHSSKRHFLDSGWDKNRTYEVTMSGRGIGLIVEGGIKLECDLWSGLGVFAEWLYQGCQVKKVTGQRTDSEIIRDGEALEIEFQFLQEKKGRWVLGKFPDIRSDGDMTSYDRFTLGLSSWALRAGLFFRF